MSKTVLIHVVTVSESLWAFFGGQIGFMKRRGFEVRGVASPGECLERFAAREQVSTHAVAMSRSITPWRDMASLWRLWRLFRKLRPSIVHSHTPKGGLLGMIGARLAGVPVRIYHVRGLPLLTATGLRRRILAWTEKTACRAAHRVFCISRSMADELISRGLCPAEKIRVAGAGGNGVDAQERFNPSNLTHDARRELRARHGIPEDATVLGFVGRVVRDKGCVELAEAWRMLRAVFPKLHLLMVGPWESEDPLPDDVERLLRLDDRVHATGAVADTRDFYGVMDVVALPTYREGFPNVAVEAAAMELPVVATRVPGCVDAVIDGETGTLVPPRNTVALARAVKTYLVAPGLRRQHGLAARRRALAEFRRETVWQALYESYIELLQRHGLPAPTDHLETPEVRGGRAA